MSTSSPEDFAESSNEWAVFRRATAEDAAASILRHEHKWVVGREGGCSCEFRHAMGAELGFGRPVDWYPETDDDLAATKRFIELVRRILYCGGSADCVDIWHGTPLGEISDREVDLARIDDEEFRFFENWRFDFKLAR